MAEVLVLLKTQAEEMLEYVKRCLPEEACGLIAGREGKASRVLPVTNMLHSPVRFRMDPQEQLNALVRLEAENLDLMGIFHSHPSGPPQPSETDVAEFAYPEAASLILSPAADGWDVRAFRIEGQWVREIEIDWVKD
jgi:proteasome lid subunit RPN8/RPN11